MYTCVPVNKDLKGYLIMSDSFFRTRTNYVHVTDAEKFRKICGLCRGECGKPLTIITKKDAVGNDTYGFYVDSDLEGYIIDANGKPVDDAVIFDTVLDYSNNYDMFIKDLQSVIAPDDALIITTIGVVKTAILTGTSLTGTSYIVTCNDFKGLHLLEKARQMAIEMLDVADWHTDFC